MPAPPAPTDDGQQLLTNAATVAIAAQFIPQGEVAAVAPLGNGNINSTYLVTVAPRAGQREAASGAIASRFVLQKINTQVFVQPEQVIRNMALVCEHLQQAPPPLGAEANADGPAADRRWETPQLLQTKAGENFWVDDAGQYWRAISYIENSQVCETVESVEHAREVGYGLAKFHSLISTLAVDKLADTLEGFHITPTYLAQYHQLLETQPTRALPRGSSSEDASLQAQVQYCRAFIAEREAWAPVLETAKADGTLQLRPIHGDPKVNNILLGGDGRAICLIDLDTLKPGLVHYDIGDCLRSGCNPLGEETDHWESVVFNTDLAQAMLEGYLSIGKTFLTEADYGYIYDAIRLITFELGLRFFTDYLAGDTYFKVSRPTHNLSRALVQFKLTESIEAQADTLRAIIARLQ